MMMDSNLSASLQRELLGGGGQAGLPATPRKGHAAASPAHHHLHDAAAAELEEPAGRFETDFELLAVIGSGVFGRVVKARMRLDGCDYAVKSMKNRFKSNADRSRMLQEVFALAHICNVEDSQHIVRYHQAWIEDERLYIQMELCDKSLEQALSEDGVMTFDEVFAFTRQMLLSLEILHKNNLVHLDIKVC